MQRTGSHLLLEENGTESGVESTDTLVLEDLSETADETAGEGGLGDQTDTGSLQRAEGDISEELSESGRTQVDGSAVVRSSLITELVDELLLEELVTTELEGTLEEVTGGGRTETSQQSASTLLLDDLAETTDQTAVVGDGVKLDSGLHAVQTRLRQFSSSWTGRMRSTGRVGALTPDTPRESVVAMASKFAGRLTHRRE